MSKRPFPDPTKRPMAALTMVYKDYYFLDLWYRYYSAQFGAENLYIISHGNDPEHRIIAPEANIIGVYRDESLFRMDRRRWAAINGFMNGLRFYYNWILTGDVDEIVVVDPDVAPDLPSYIYHLNGENAPRSFSPLGVELVHNPSLETQPVLDRGTVLDRRQIFRLNANYSKPCINRHASNFTVGGHANNVLPRHLDDHLYLFHLRFFDHERSVARLTSRTEMREVMDAGRDPSTTNQAWRADLQKLEALSSGKPVAQTIDFPDFRKMMIEKTKLLHNDKVAFFGGGRSKELYQLPERFWSLF